MNVSMSPADEERIHGKLSPIFWGIHYDYRTEDTEDGPVTKRVEFGIMLMCSDEGYNYTWFAEDAEEAKKEEAECAADGEHGARVRREWARRARYGGTAHDEWEQETREMERRSR